MRRLRELPTGILLRGATERLGLPRELRKRRGLQDRLCVYTRDGSRYERRLDGERLHRLRPPFLSPVGDRIAWYEV